MNINGLEIQWIVSPFTGKARNWESRMANMNNMGQFSGDMDRNEVEIDLNKFMALLQEKSELKDRIRELEDTKNDNPYQKLIFIAQAVDSWRIIPRAFLSIYIICYTSS